MIFVAAAVPVLDECHGDKRVSPFPGGGRGKTYIVSR